MPSLANYIDYIIGILGITVATFISIWIYKQEKREKLRIKEHKDLRDVSITYPKTNISNTEMHERFSNVFYIANKSFDYIPIVSSWKPGENEYYYGSLRVLTEGKNYTIPDDINKHFLKKDLTLQNEINKNVKEPKVRINSFRLDVFGENKYNQLVFSFSKITYRDFLIANCFLDEKPAGEEYRFRDKYFTCNNSIIMPDLSNICGVGLYIITKDEKIIICKASEFVKVNPGKYIYSASGTMNWYDNTDRINPFYDIIRESEEEIDFTPKIEDLTLYSFGLDYKLGYYQFSFYTRANQTGEEIIRGAGMARDHHFEMKQIIAIDFNCKSIVDHIQNNDWDATAAANLLTLASKFFGKEAIEEQINPQYVHNYHKDELIYEWEMRAKRQGKFAVLSLRYPPDAIDDISDSYLKNALYFIDDPLKNKTVIEIGGGIGLFTKHFAQNAKSITVIDISQEMINRNKAYLGPELSKRVRYINCFFQEYDENHIYDIMICSLVLIHNYYDIENMTRNMRKKAKIIYLFEQIDGGQASSITKSLSMQEYISLFPDFTLKKTQEYFLSTDKIGFMKLVKKVREEKSANDFQ